LLSDNELTTRFRNDSVEAFREIYSRYWRMVYLLAYKKLNNREVAEELTQNLFVSLWEKRLEVNIGNLRAYLLTALKYSIIKHYRSLLVQGKYLAHCNGSTQEYENPVEQHIHAADLGKAINEALAQLPPKTRQIFELSRYDLLSNRQIAESLGVSEKTVEYHITQSVKILRGYLKDYLILLLVPLLFFG